MRRNWLPSWRRLRRLPSSLRTNSYPPPRLHWGSNPQTQSFHDGNRCLSLSSFLINRESKHTNIHPRNLKLACGRIFPGPVPESVRKVGTHFQIKNYLFSSYRLPHSLKKALPRANLLDRHRIYHLNLTTKARR
jgi:hypothetical protein